MEANSLPNSVSPPASPNPEVLPIEVDPGSFTTKPEVDYGNEPLTPMDPDPGTPLPTIPEREEPPHRPETEPGVGQARQPSREQVPLLPGPLR
jgi:hypothetical protein